MNTSKTYLNPGSFRGGDQCALIKRAREIVQKYVDHFPDDVETAGDDLATTWGCAKLVLLAIAAAKSTDALTLALTTGLPEDFIECLVKSLTDADLLGTAWYRDIACTLADEDATAINLQGSLDHAVECLWAACYSNTFVIQLEITRARRIFPGVCQTYRDEAAITELLGG